MRKPCGVSARRPRSGDSRRGTCTCSPRTVSAGAWGQPGPPAPARPISLFPLPTVTCVDLLRTVSSRLCPKRASWPRAAGPSLSLTRGDRTWARRPPPPRPSQQLFSEPGASRRARPSAVHSGPAPGRARGRALGLQLLTLSPSRREVRQAPEGGEPSPSVLSPGLSPRVESPGPADPGPQGGDNRLPGGGPMGAGDLGQGRVGERRTLGPGPTFLPSRVCGAAGDPAARSPPGGALSALAQAPHVPAGQPPDPSASTPPPRWGRHPLCRRRNGAVLCSEPPGPRSTVPGPDRGLALGAGSA